MPRNPLLVRGARRCATCGAPIVERAGRSGLVKGQSRRYCERRECILAGIGFPAGWQPPAWWNAYGTGRTGGTTAEAAQGHPREAQEGGER